MSFSINSDLGPEVVVCITEDDLELDDPPCTLNTVLYLFTIMQYITCCLVFSISKPFRKPVYTNPLYLSAVTLMGVYGIYMILYLDDWSAETFQLL